MTNAAQLKVAHWFQTLTRQMPFPLRVLFGVLGFVLAYVGLSAVVYGAVSSVIVLGVFGAKHLIISGSVVLGIGFLAVLYHYRLAPIIRARRAARSRANPAVQRSVTELSPPAPEAKPPAGS